MTGIFLAVFLLAAVGISFAGGYAMRFLVNKVPTKYENDIGDKLVAKLKEEELLTDNTKVMSVIGGK